MIGLLALALAAQAVDPAAIPAKDLRELDRCNPQRIGEASDCMRRALGEKAAAEINKPEGERYRAAFAQLITEKWDLANPDSPVARDMRGLRIYDSSDAAYVLLVDMAARIGRYRLDYDKFARERATRPPQPAVVAAPTPKQPDVKPGPLALDKCRRPEDAPSLQTVTCTLNADRTISRTTSGAPGAGVPAGATPLPMERCESMGPVPPRSYLKACYKLPDGRVLRQTARAAAPSDK